MINGFLLGMVVTMFLTASAFFLKFWRQTRDILFLGFGAAFLIEACNRTAFLLLENPNDGHPLIYTVRLLSYLLILAAIVHKNRR
jgi:hypothetical protein